MNEERVRKDDDTNRCKMVVDLKAEVDTVSQRGLVYELDHV